MSKARVSAVCLCFMVFVLSGCSSTSEKPPVVQPTSPTVPEDSLTVPRTTAGASQECVDRQNLSSDPQAGAPLVLGAFMRGVEDDPSEINEFTEMVGEKPSTVMVYQNWEEHGEFDRGLIDAVRARGATPLVTWAPRDPERGRGQREYSLQKITRGRYDTYIRQWARGAAAWGDPLYLRFAHEMNSHFFPWGVGVKGNTGADYVAAWRHIHDIFAQEGATNVRWVWSPLADVPTSRDALEQMYPGDDYVDWLALDGYNWGTEGLALAEWRTMAEIFGPFHDKLADISDKPMMIAEVASAEAGGSKANWIEEGLLEDVPSRLPQVRAVVWFSSNKLMDWRVNSSQESLAAYSRVAASCLYQGQLP